MTPATQAAIAGIADDAWTPVRYPRAVFDDQLSRWVSDAEVVEKPPAPDGPGMPRLAVVPPTPRT